MLHVSVSIALECALPSSVRETLLSDAFPVFLVASRAVTLAVALVISLAAALAVAPLCSTDGQH